MIYSLLIFTCAAGWYELTRFEDSDDIDDLMSGYDLAETAAQELNLLPSDYRIVRVK